MNAFPTVTASSTIPSTMYQVEQWIIVNEWEINTHQMKYGWYEQNNNEYQQSSGMWIHHQMNVTEYCRTECKCRECMNKCRSSSRTESMNKQEYNRSSTRHNVNVDNTYVIRILNVSNDINTDNNTIDSQWILSSE